MLYLRFAPSEYRVLARACRRLNLGGSSVRSFQDLLIVALADVAPGLAERIAGLGPVEVRLLYNHFRRRPPDRRGHGLSPADVQVLAAAFGPLFGSRFSRPLKRALVRHLLDQDPALARRLHYLPAQRFEALCEHIRRRLSRGT